MFRRQYSPYLALCSALVLGSACSDNPAPDGSGEAGEGTGGSGRGGTAGTGGTAGAQEPVAGAGAAGEDPLPEDEGIYVVGGYVTVQEKYFGYLAVTDDISAAGSIDLENVIEFPDDMSFASPGNGIVYVGNGSAPVIERWVLDGSNQLVKNGEVGLSQYGIASGLGAIN